MRLSATLTRYIGRQFILWFLMLVGVLLGLILLLDTAELLRRAANRADVPLSLVLQMALFKLPGIGQQILPFAVLFAAMFTFWKMTRSQELVVARAAGVSAWQFLAPVLIGAVLVGAVEVAVVNPIGSALVARYHKLEDKHLRGKGSQLNVSLSGLWLRQVQDDRQYLIHADTVSPAKAELRRVNVFLFKGQNNYVGRLDAPLARLDKGRWRLYNSWYNEPDRPPEFRKTVDIPTDFTLDKIEENFAAPESVSFWALPRFIRTLEETGFTAVRHRLHYQSLLAQPFLFCAMVLFAAAFSLRQTRRGGTLLMITGGVITGFVLFVMTDVILTVGMSEAIPVAMAAWTPTGVSLLVGMAILFHLEDG